MGHNSTGLQLRGVERERRLHACRIGFGSPLTSLGDPEAVDPAYFAEADVSEPVTASPFIEVETGLFVRHTSIISGCSPCETTDVVSFFVVVRIREIAVEACDGGLRGLRVQFAEHRPLPLPFGEFVVLIVLTRVVVFRGLFIVPPDVVVELAMNVGMMFQSFRYLFG